MSILDRLMPLAENEGSEDKVLQSLIDPDLADLTCEIADYHAMSVMEIVADQLSIEGLTKSSELLERFVYKEKYNSIASKRKRAGEIISGVGAKQKLKRSFTHRMIGKNIDIED